MCAQLGLLLPTFYVHAAETAEQGEEHRECKGVATCTHASPPCVLSKARQIESATAYLRSLGLGQLID